MGWSFRKSAKLGPFRINFSKSGLGVSAGVKGARLSVGPRGTYVTLGANGIYYRQRIRSTPHRNSSDSFYHNPASNEQPIDTLSIDTRDTITTKSLDEVTDVDSKAFIDELESKERKFLLLPFVGIVTAIIFFAFVSLWLNEIIRVEKEFSPIFRIIKDDVNIRDSPSKSGLVAVKANSRDEFKLVKPDSLGWTRVLIAKIHREGFVHSNLGVVDSVLLFQKGITRLEKYPGTRIPLHLFAFVLCIIWCVYIHRLDQRRKTLSIHYSMDRDLIGLHKNFILTFMEFAKSKKIWQKLKSQYVSETRYTGGASQLVARAPLTRIEKNKRPSRFLKTNVPTPYIGLKNIELYFFPERVVLKRGKKFAAVFYKNLRVDISTIRFIEEEGIASDALVIDRTWKYLNKNGGPDKRFKGNYQIPICKYSEYSFESENGVHEVITTSKPEAMDKFMRFIELIGEYQRKLEMN